MSGTMIGTQHISFQKKMSWLLALVTAILVSPFISTLSLTAPNEITQGESFSLTLTHDDQATADIKVFVQSQALQNLSKLIIEGNEKSTFYYLKEVFPTQTTFTLKVVQSGTNAELCIRLRKTGKTTYEEVCQPLVIKKIDQPEETSPVSKKETPSKKESSKEATLSRTALPSNQTVSPSVSTPTSFVPSSPPEPIHLNSTQAIRTFDSGVLLKVGLFTLLTLTILILLILGKI